GDAAGIVSRFGAIGVAGRFVGIVFVDDDDVVDAVHQRMQQGIFRAAHAAGGHGLHDEVATLEGVHGEVVHVARAAGAGVVRAVPDISDLFRVDGRAAAQAIELQV